MNILISGSSGFLGTYLKNKFINDGYNIFELNRKDFRLDNISFSKKFDNIDIVINLAGAPIIDRWTNDYKKIIYKSRIDTTKKISETIKILEKNPKLFINASAVGIYKQGLVHDEYSKELDDGFLGDIVKNWEKEALKCEDNCRVVITRFGVILGNGGFLSKLLTIFKLGIGGKIGNGDFIMNFVDIEDIYRFYKFSIENNNINGVFNLSNINIKNKNFTKIFGKVLKRPTLIPVPRFILRLHYGEGSKVIFSYMQVNPKRTLDSGFKFLSDDLEEVLRKYV